MTWQLVILILGLIWAFVAVIAIAAFYGMWQRTEEEQRKKDYG